MTGTKKISELSSIAVLAPEDIILVVDSSAPVGEGTKRMSPEAFFGEIPVDLGITGHVFQNEPFSYAGKRIEIISPYVPKDNEYKGQLHFHSTESDGVDTPAAIVTAYRDAGYDFVSLTDHDVLAADPGVDGILFISGVEESAVEGHITSTNPTAVSGPAIPFSTTPAQGIIDDILADGAMPSMAHPNVVAIEWTNEELEGFGGYFAVEVYNDLAGALVSNAEDKWDALLSKHIRAFGNAVDDCHDLSGIHFDKGWVQVFADSLTTANIMDSLKRGNYYASTGPTISISVSKKVITITADSAATIAFIGDGGAVLQTTASVTTASYTVVGDEVYVRVKITRDSDSKIAWSNPIYVYLMSSSPVSLAGLIRGNAYIRGDVTIDDDVVGGGSARFANIGVGVAPDANYPVYIKPTLTSPDTSQQGIYCYTTINPTADNNVYPKGQNIALYTGGVFDFTSVISASLATFRHAGTGDIAKATGMSAGIQLQHDTGEIAIAAALETIAPTWMDGNKTIVTNYGQWIRNQGHANITTSYGLRIDPQTGSATNYAIYLSTGLVSFLDNLTFRSAATIAAAAGNLTIDSVAGYVDLRCVGTSDVPLAGGILMGTSDAWWGLRFAATDLADLCLDRNYGGNEYEVLRFDRSTGHVQIGTAVDNGMVAIDQSNNAAAIPVLTLDQADESEGFINFIGSDRGVIAGATGSAVSVRVELDGTVYRLALYADA